MIGNYVILMIYTMCVLIICIFKKQKQSSRLALPKVALPLQLRQSFILSTTYGHCSPWAFAHHLFLWSGKQPVLMHNFLQGLVQDSPSLESLSLAAPTHTVSPALGPTQHMYTKSSIPDAHPLSISTHSTCFQATSLSPTKL